MKDNENYSYEPQVENFVNPYAFNFAASVGFVYFLYICFQIYRFLISLAGFDCGRACIPAWVSNEYFFDKIPHGILALILLSLFIIFLILCFVFKNVKPKKKNIKHPVCDFLFEAFRGFFVFIFLCPIIYILDFLWRNFITFLYR